MNFFQIVFASFIGTIAARALWDWLGLRRKKAHTLAIVMREIGGPDHGKLSRFALEVNETITARQPTGEPCLHVDRTTEAGLLISFVTSEATPEQVEAGGILYERPEAVEDKLSDMGMPGTLPGPWPLITNDDEYAAAAIAVDKYARDTRARSRMPHFTLASSEMGVPVPETDGVGGALP